MPQSEFYYGHYVENLVKFVSNANILITDCTYTDAEYETKVGWGHSCLSQVAKLAHEANVETLYLFHHDPDQDDDAIDDKHKTVQEMLTDLGSATRCVAPAEGDTIRL